MARALLVAIMCVVSAEYCFAWVYHGCYQNNAVGHFETMVDNGTMTIEKCIQLCSYEGNFYAGVEDGTECFCGNHINPDYERLEDTECSTACSADPTQNCGGPMKVSIYSTYKYEGCYVDNETRILEGEQTGDDFMTTEMCINRCKNENTVFALTEYSTECFCGNILKPYEKKSDAECDHTCDGAPTEKCGGVWHGSLYRV